MKFYEYHPNFVEGFDKEVVELGNSQDALQTNTCRRWARSEEFVRFLIEPYDNRQMVRAEMKDGSKWVVGFIK